MNKKIFSVLILSMLSVSLLKAQKDESKSDEKNKKSDKVTIEVHGNRITINGVPATEFKDDILEIITGDSLIYNDKNGFGKIFNFYNKAYLGVYSEKVSNGAKITEVSKNSAAEKAGLKKEDIITQINDEKITEQTSLANIISKHKIGDKIMITYLRNGKIETTQAVLEKSKTPIITTFGNKKFEKGFETPDGKYFYNTFPRRPKIGIQIQDVEEGNGVKVLEVEDETPAAKAGLKKDDIITEVEGTTLKNVDDLRNKLKDYNEGDVFKIKYKRANKAYTTEIKLPKKLKKATL
ncbi:MAG: PDZ domain-containing protein [Chitinophagales bacterium]|nr:PDZ domain-containing protein [Chitinophagales bacterium]